VVRLEARVIGYWPNQYEIQVQMLTGGRLADTAWWVDDKGLFQREVINKGRWIP
jgi:hypothetical protein